MERPEHADVALDTGNALAPKIVPHRHEHGSEDHRARGVSARKWQLPGGVRDGILARDGRTERRLCRLVGGLHCRAAVCAFGDAAGRRDLLADGELVGNEMAC